MINPMKTIYHKDWDEIQEYDYYNGTCTDSKILIVDEHTDKQEKFLEAIAKACHNEYSWDYADSVIIDYEDNCAYSDGYGESDVLYTNEEYIGRRRFDNKEVSFEDIEDEFINTTTKAIPSWLELPEEWVEESCDFQSGWYDRHDDPETILSRLPKDLDAVFKIRSINPFAVDFCVFTRETGKGN